MGLIPRPTPLEKGGMAGWLNAFRRGVLDKLPEASYVSLRLSMKGLSRCSRPHYAMKTVTGSPTTCASDLLRVSDVLAW